MGKADFLDKNRIVAEIKQLQCPTHGNHPDVAFEGDSLSVKCCCKEFQAQMEPRANELFKQEADRAVQDMMNKMFR